MPVGSFTLVLHSHRPYIFGSGQWWRSTDCLYEACAESYFPLLNMLNQLIDEGIQPKIVISFSPVLVEQLADYNFADQFLHYLQNMTDSVISNQQEFKEFNQIHRYRLAKWWQEYYTTIMVDFIERYKREIIGNFSRLQEEGYVEIITSAATHSYLPLLSMETSVFRQIKLGIEAYQRHFGKQPRGFWLPECGYRPVGQGERGLEELLVEAGIDYFIVDSHLACQGEPVGAYADRFETLRFTCPSTTQGHREQVCPYNVYLSGEGRPVAVFIRDAESWRAVREYPNDSCYLDSHKRHFPGEHRYWQVTSRQNDPLGKLEYEPEYVDERLRRQATNFKNLVKEALKGYYQQTGCQGIIVAAFNTEWFGHYWFEGIRWLGYLLKEINNDKEIELSTCSQRLDQHPPETVIPLAEGSWGEGGGHGIWLNQETEWIWRHLHEAERTREQLFSQYRQGEDSRMQEILRQLTRELLLLQSSDWPFLITTRADRDYATDRLLKHFESFNRLAQLCRNYAEGEEIEQADWDFLAYCQKREPLFEAMDLF